MTVAIEHRGAEAIVALASAYEAIEREGMPEVVSCLQTVADVVKDLRSLLLRMREGCAPEVRTPACVMLAAQCHTSDVDGGLTVCRCFVLCICAEFLPRRTTFSRRMERWQCAARGSCLRGR